MLFYNYLLVQIQSIYTQMGLCKPFAARGKERRKERGKEGLKINLKIIIILILRIDSYQNLI